MLGNDPRCRFVRLPNYKENPTTQYYRERNLQRRAYLRYLLPHHDFTKETAGKDVALHHFHPRIVARLVSKLQKQIPKTVAETELQQLGVVVDPRDRILDDEGQPTGRCIFAPSYPIESAKEDLKRLLRLCQALNEAKEKDDTTRASSSSSPKSRKRKKRKFLADIRNEGDNLVVERTRRYSSSSSLDDRDERTARSSSSSDEQRQQQQQRACLDSLAEHNIQSLLFHNIRLEPIPEDVNESFGGVMEDKPLREPGSVPEEVSVSWHEEEFPTAEMQEPNDTQRNDDQQVSKQDEQDNLNVDTLPNLDTDLDSASSVSTTTTHEEQEEDQLKSTNNAVAVSMRIRLEKLHTGKGKARMSKVMKKPPSPFFEISILHEGGGDVDNSANHRKTLYRSYPLTDTKNGTWDPIQDLHVEQQSVLSPQDLSFCITVYDCDTRAGNHLLIGTSLVHALDLLITSSLSVPVLREEKVKGFLEISSFQLVAEPSTAIGSTHTSRDNFASSVESIREPLQDRLIRSGNVNELTDVIDAGDASTRGVAGNEAAEEKSTFVDNSPAKTAETLPAADSSLNESIAASSSHELDSPCSSPLGIDNEEHEQPSSSLTPGGGYNDDDVSRTNAETDDVASLETSSFESTDLSSVSALSMPSISILQISLDDLRTGKKKSLAGKVLHKSAPPSPFFDFAVLQEEDGASPTWQTLYQSYPLLNTNSGTWDVVQDLCLGVLVKSNDDLSFRITVHDCDQKNGHHMLIGQAQVKASELVDTAAAAANVNSNNNDSSSSSSSPTFISLIRGGKVKGRLRFDQFEMDWSA